MLTEALSRTVAHTGQDALQELARALGETLAARRAHISGYSPDEPGRLRYMAMWDGQTVNMDGTFLIEGSASEQILLHGECHYWENFVEQFPHHADRYIAWGARSYLGAPLKDSEGRIIGVIALMLGEDYQDRELATTVFRLFAMRASGELNRMLLEARRGALENTLRAVVRGTADVLGAAFFNALVLELGRALGARAVYLTRLYPSDPARVLRVAGMEDGRLLPSEPVMLPAKSPTRDTMAAGFLRVRDSLLGRYPGNPALERLKVDSFTGVALRSARGEPLGALTMLGGDPLQDSELVRSMLLIFAARAAAEIQRVEADEAIARIDSQLRQTQKLEAMGTLAGGVAHDFNNILAGIMGNTQLAQLSVDEKPGAVRRHLDLVMQSCIRARDLIGRILAFSRNHEQARECCALGNLVEEVVALLKTGLSPHIALSVRLPREEMHILADPGQIHQLLLNLGTNAIYVLSQKGGTLEIAIDEIAPDDAWRGEHMQVRPEHTVRISVRDNGPGIPAELQERIFEPFFTTKPTGHGSGLGLAGVHGMMRAHGGVIVLESAPDRGTTFHLCFERHPPPEGAEREVGTTDETDGGSRLNLLFVDDETMITQVAEIGLNHHGWQVRAFNDPREALAVFRENPGSFDALVSDLSMPGMDGAMFAREVLALRPEVPVLIITGYMREAEIEAARESGVSRFLSKPFDLDVLDKTLRAMVAERKA